jgi:enamine deaminase RidA (YjgF/YER057c/UK114 family)
LFVSGNIPLDPATGETVAGGIEEQAKQALKNLRAVVEASGSGLGKVVKTTVSRSVSIPHLVSYDFLRCSSSR